MKQRITPEQLNGLTQEQKDKLREWWTPTQYDVVLYEGFNNIHVVQNYDGLTVKFENGNGTWANHCLPLLSIGQMIELLLKQNEFSIETHRDLTQVSWKEADGTYISWMKVELCDALWQAVKHSLGEVKE